MSLCVVIRGNLTINPQFRRVMNHAELTKTLAKKTGSTQASIKLVLEKLQETISDELKANAKFELKDIGTFKVLETSARTGRNPATGDPVDIPAGKRIKFKSSKVLKTIAI